MYLSAARSYLFNKIVAERVKQETWNQALLGDVMLLEGSNRQFLVETLEEEIQQRVDTFDVHPSGAMPGGRGRALSPEHQTAELENALLSDDTSKTWIEGLGRNRIDADRRSLRLMPESFNYEWRDNDLVLKFSLDSGMYATSLLREFFKSNI